MDPLKNLALHFTLHQETHLLHVIIFITGHLRHQVKLYLEAASKTVMSYEMTTSMEQTVSSVANR
jgi:hypothetical protein